MEIHEIKTYRFVFPFMGEGFITLNVPANTQKDAAIFLKEWMNRTQIELSMAFPETAPTPPIGGPTDPPPEFNALQIGLMEDVATACGKLTTSNLANFILEKTGLEMTIENFKEIIPALIAIRDGTPKNDKKK